MLQEIDTTTATLNNTNTAVTTTTTATNLNDYQLQQRSLKSKICRSIRNTKNVLKFKQKFRKRD